MGKGECLDRLVLYEQMLLLRYTDCTTLPWFLGSLRPCDLY